ncbi:MAG: hypothetical protein QOJ19_1169 [Acidimicrobiia bacterium]|jgi:hypothetical protein|nr:hypothetical protein [Acidimicrobiia bacterium]
MDHQSSVLDRQPCVDRPSACRTSPLPEARGCITEVLFGALTRSGDLADVPLRDDPLTGDDFHLALYCCYELHYQGFEGISDTWEWDPRLISFRHRLEQAFERRLRDEVAPLPQGPVVPVLHALANAPGPSLSRYMANEGTIWQFREFVVHRSPYQLKEADPHTWVIPRLRGAPKASTIKLQMEEYGEGVEADMHSTLFAEVMDELGLDPTYGHYLDVVPGSTLATTNLISMCGLNRRLRGALVGHLALFEMTSVLPMSRYSSALERLNAGPRARRFYDVHIDADTVHEVLASEHLAGRLADEEPELAADIIFGAAAANVVEAGFATAILDAWGNGRSSLRSPLSC